MIPGGKMPDGLDELIQAVQDGARYKTIAPDLVRRIATQEVAKGRGLKETVKAVRNKLHQVGGAYVDKSIPYARLGDELDRLPGDRNHPDLRAFCRRVMALHASTRERLPILESFYQDTLATLIPIPTMVDLACGLNPLALPWMPLDPDGVYWGYDIYTDQADFLNHFLAHIQQAGKVVTYDLAQGAPQQDAQVTLLLKTIPCLEQVDPCAGARLLETIQTERILVSFPARSLGGRNKGMVGNYEGRFRQLTSGQHWQVERFEFASELAFLIRK